LNDNSSKSGSDTVVSTLVTWFCCSTSLYVLFVNLRPPPCCNQNRIVNLPLPNSHN
jgi:hypothetical protein